MGALFEDVKGPRPVMVRAMGEIRVGDMVRRRVENRIMSWSGDNRVYRVTSAEDNAFMIQLEHRTGLWDPDRFEVVTPVEEQQ